MAKVIKRCGRFRFVQTGQGFVWTLKGPGGEWWYWHPEARQWNCHADFSPTPEQATRGLDPDAPQAESRFRHHEAASSR